MVTSQKFQKEASVRHEKDIDKDSREESVRIVPDLFNAIRINKDRGTLLIKMIWR